VDGVVRQTGFSQVRKQFLFEITFLAMLRLVANVCLQGVQLRRADAEGVYPYLPLKGYGMLAEPAGGIGFQFLDGFSQRQLRW
jgi:hypothetical protein